ncbi:hypothetical protein MUY27_09975 [Mucilaginibacter sp. RS28]|uniref:Altered inheritance of mitochondria protein 6 n=1 Tax=Mucilaginibacter straminoryzae TaxID=2932774 RepID=A0A9X1X2I4_9SPHI|nr:hypothetical protein [Mucilaginibacter straminoryzae]MCJ8210037.1 hypothetical protein [Mucilaginibacter straminoryzae]
MKLFTLLVFWATLLNALNTTAQYLPHAHSHNDYNQSNPFHHAYDAGFGAIEADVFFRNGTLLVGHDKEKLSPGRTLEKLYLEPLKKELKKDTARRVTLLIDNKEDYSTIMPELIKELKPLLTYLTNQDEEPRLKILISGNRPPPALFKSYPEYILFDEDLKQNYTTEELPKIGQISLRFSDYSAWKGDGALPEKDRERLKNVIDRVHAMGKPIRFWDALDNTAGWKMLQDLGVDVIGTDDIDQLRDFLLHGSK